MDAEPKRFNYIDALWQSFFSPLLYVDVAKRWRGVGFVYLLLIVVISWAPDLAKLHIDLQAWRGEAGEAYIRQIPAITITKGVASADVETPCFIKDPKDGKVLGIIDFTGQYTSLENTSAVVLLNRKEVTSKQSGNEVRTYSLSGVEHFSIDQNRVRRWVQLFLTWFVVFIAPWVIVFTFAFRIVQALVYGAVGMAFANSFRVKLTYSALLRLTCVALTPVVFITTAAEFLPLHYPFPRFWAWMFHVALALFYLGFAVKACATAAVASPPTPASPAPLG